MDKRKLAMPVATLAMSMLLLVGIGFAITANVTNQGNTVNADGVIIDLYSDNAATNVVTESVFSNGTLQYAGHSVNGTMTYEVPEDQVLTLSDDHTYIKSTKTGEIKVSAIGITSLFKSVTVTVGGESVTLNSGNSYTATFVSSPDTTTAQQVTVTATTAAYNDSTEPSEINNISVIFALTPSA